MFRRKKAKGSKSKSLANDDDMVAPLTGPRGLCSSSSADPVVVAKVSGASSGSKATSGGSGGGSRFLPGRRQKNKIGEDVDENGAKHNGAAGSQQPVVTGSAAKEKLSQPQQQQQQQQPQQSSLGAAPRAPKLTSKRASKNVAPANAESSTQHQQLSTSGAHSKLVEMRDEHENTSRQPQYHHHPTTNTTTDSTRGGGRNSSNDFFPSGRPSQNGGAMPTTTLPTTSPPPVLIPNASNPQLFMNEGGRSGGQQQQQQHIGFSPGGTAIVPRTRSGWSLQSNGSSAMNSENYIQSLDNLPNRGGKVSFIWCLDIYYGVFPHFVSPSLMSSCTLTPGLSNAKFPA